MFINFSNIKYILNQLKFFLTPPKSLNSIQTISFVYKMTLLSTRLPDDLKKYLKWYADKERIGMSIAMRKVIDRGIKEIRLEYALEKLREHSITLGKAAELAGISIWEMMDIVKEKRIDWLGLTPEDIDRDLEIIKRLK